MVSIFRGARRDDLLQLTSVSRSGVLARSMIELSGEPIDAMVNMASLAAFTRGATDVSLRVKEGRLHVDGGKKLRGDIPALNEGQPEFPQNDSNNHLADDDVTWLRHNLRRVRMSDLDNTGFLSAECNGREWRMGCADDVHGACAFCVGKSRISFAIAPRRGDALRVLLDASVHLRGEVAIDNAAGSLMVSAGAHRIAIPTVKGLPPRREVIQEGLDDVALFMAGELRNLLRALAPVASAKDPYPVRVKITDNEIRMSVSSPTGTVEHELSPSGLRTPCEFRISHALLADLAARAEGETMLGVSSENEEIERILLRCGDLYLVCLTGFV